VGLISFFSAPKPNKTEQAPPPATSAAPATGESGGEQLRSLSSVFTRIPADKAQELVVGALSVNITTFEEKYAGTRGVRNKDSDFREACLTHNLLSNLVGGNYMGFIAAHCLIYANRLRGWTWAPTTREEILHIGEMGAPLFLDSYYQLTSQQQEREQAVLSQGTSQSSARALAVIIETARWDVARITLCAMMDTLSRNLMEVWAGPEAHERLVYQTLMLTLRIDNAAGALLMHQLAMAHHQRGWEWRPSPDEFHAVAECAARPLVDKRYDAAALVR
jgi:hypothetical protein